MNAPYTIFGETRLVHVKVYKDRKITDETEWDEEIWVERGEDWYALSCPDYNGKRIRVIERNEWLRSRRVDPDHQTHTPLAKTDASQGEAQPSSFSHKMANPENPKEAIE